MSGRQEQTRKSLIKCISTIKEDNVTGCEVGVWKGEASKLLLQTFSHLFLYMIDPWKIENSQMKGITTQKDFDNAFREAVRQTILYKDRRCIMKNTSLEACSLFDDTKLDFVFIDANHFYEFVLEDIEHWWSKVKHILIGHDYGCYMDSRGKWGVKKAVDEFVDRHNLELKIYPGYIWSISK